MAKAKAKTQTRMKQNFDNNCHFQQFAQFGTTVIQYAGRCTQHVLTDLIDS